MIRRIAALSVLGLLSAGCVSTDKYNALKLDRDGLAEQLSRAQIEVESAQARELALQKQLEAFRAAGPNSNALVANLTEQNAQLRAQLDELNRRYSEAVGRIGSGPALPQALTNELTAFAAQNADLVEFDPIKGIVKFKSDVTFAPGDATLTTAARDVIGRFSSILNSPGAASYELLIAGHTDNDPVSNPRTIQAGHKDNWYLSAHRAISVKDALTRMNVSPRRIGVVGYADQRPVASNATSAGKAANRRVEVLILPNQIADTTPINAAPASSAPAVRIESSRPDPALSK